MITDRVVVDTGPLVALLDRDDAHHESCKAVFANLRGPVYTTWPVITEAAWLLRNISGGPQGVLALIESGVFVCFELGPESAEWIRKFLDQYADLRPQLADASIAYAAEELGTETVFTLDRRDFLVFRSRSGKAFRLLPDHIQ